MNIKKVFKLFLVIPSIDIRKGKNVRLIKGSPKAETVYEISPLEAAFNWLEKGAKTIHVIDLDAAFGEGENEEIIREIITNIDVKVQVGGGIRTLEKAFRLLEMGAERVILGTLAFKQPESITELAKEAGSRHVMVAIDHLKGAVAVEGWKKVTKLDVLEAAKLSVEKGANWLLVTSILKDGTLSGPEVGSLKRLRVELKETKIIASGGISTLKDILEVKKIRMDGVVVGKALHEGKISLEEALKIEKEV